MCGWSDRAGERIRLRGRVVVRRWDSNRTVRCPSHGREVVRCLFVSFPINVIGYLELALFFFTFF
jgi:hypothetical protein